MEDRIDTLLDVMSLIRRGQELMLDGLNAMNERIGAIETELTKEPPPSKAAEVLRDLVEAVDNVAAQMADLTEVVQEAVSETSDFDDADPA